MLVTKSEACCTCVPHELTNLIQHNELKAADANASKQVDVFVVSLCKQRQGHHVDRQDDFINSDAAANGCS